MGNEINKLYEFDKFLIDTGKEVLWCDNEPVELPLKAIQLLCVLVENPGAVVSKNELLDRVWKDSFVEESILSQNVYRLRKVFKDSGSEADLIKTIPRRGYRFAGEVREIVEETDTEIVVERHILERLTIEEDDDDSNSQSPTLALPEVSRGSKRNRYFAAFILIGGLVLLSGFIWQNYYTADPDDKVKSLAVLPLKNLTENDDNKSLSLGLADNLITRLGSLNHYTVRPLSAVVKFAESGKDAVKFGTELQVDAVLTGTIQEIDGRLRVSVRLINTKNGSQIWEGSFDETKNNIFELQDALSAQVARSLTSRLTQNEQNKLKANLTDSPEAYQAYLKGLYFWSTRTKEGLLKAITYFQKAVEIDPNFAEAYVGLADSQFLLFDYRWDTSQENPRRAKENLLKALSIKSSLAGALTTLGTIQSIDWDWRAAEASFKRALEFEPNSSQALHRYGTLQIRMRKFSEAEEMLAGALMLDPLSVAANMNYGVAFLYGGKLERAEQQLKSTLEIAPKFSPARWYLGRCYWLQGRKAEAVAEFIRALEDSGEMETASKVRAAKGNVTDKIRVWYADWERQYDENVTDGHDLAFASSFLQDKELTLKWLENSVENHNAWSAWIYCEPEFDFVRKEPRFLEMMKKMKIMSANQ